MKIGLLGFGTVGAGVYHIIEKQESMEVKYVLDLREFEELGDKLVHDYSVILNDPEVETVVEVLGGLHPSYEFVSQAICAGKNVVTANKHLVCHYFTELTSLAKQHGVAFRCTAAVGGGLPWLTSLERAKRVDTISQIWGIMNGTTNYILDTMRLSPVAFDTVLKEAQALGYAEADPSADIDGLDIQRKLIISSNIAFNCLLTENDVPVFGIRGIRKEDIDLFKKEGLVCKLIANGIRVDDGVAAFVEPVLLPSAEPDANVPSNFNLITFVGENVGRLSFYGQGAGRYPTAFNCVQDCVDLVCGVKDFYATKMETVPVKNEKQMRSYYVRTSAPDAWLESVTSKTMGNGILTSPVSVKEMHEWARNKVKEDPECFIAGIQ